MQTVTINQCVLNELKHNISIKSKKISDESDHDSDSDFESYTSTSSDNLSNYSKKSIDYLSIYYSLNKQDINLDSPPPIVSLNGFANDSSIISKNESSTRTVSHKTLIDYNPILKIEQLRGSIETFVQSIQAKIKTMESLNSEIKNDLDYIMHILNSNYLL